MLLYAQTTGTHNTNNGNWTAIPGLEVILPQGVGDSALVILNVPNPYAQGIANPGGSFGIMVNNQVQSVVASFTYNEPSPPSDGRIPTTLSLVVPLSSSQDLTVVAVWAGVRGANVVIDSPATLTAVIA